MPVEALKFDGQASGLEALAGAPQLCANTLTDLGGTVKARPGVAAWSGFPAVLPASSPVDAMVVFGTSLVYVTRDRRLWLCDAAGTVTALSDFNILTQLDGTLRPQLLALRTKVVAVGGGAPQTSIGVGVSARLAGSPPNATTLAGIATRIVLGVNDTSGTFRWSGLGDTGHVVWDALNFAEAESKPDVIKAIADNTNELFAFGAETLQVFSPDAILGFAPGRALNIGLIAPYSLVRVDDMFGFLDREKRFVVTDGRSFNDNISVVSKPIEASLLGLSTVTDCFGFRMRTDRWDAAVWMFPTDGKGFIWNRRNNEWSEWRGWNQAMGGYAPPTITSALHWPERGLFLVGLASGQIAKLDAAAHTDLGTTFKVELLSGFVDHGTDGLKQNISASFVFKRGVTAQVSTAPVVHISWRDDTEAWSRPLIANLGTVGHADPVIRPRSLGVYRRRQWRIEYTSNAEFAFIGAREEFALLNA